MSKYGYFCIQSYIIVTVPFSSTRSLSPVFTLARNSLPRRSIAITSLDSHIFASTIPLAASESICSENKKHAGFIVNVDKASSADVYLLIRHVKKALCEMGVNAPYFENGQATLLISNNADSVFRAVIDNTGALQGEPEKVDVTVF